MWECLPVDDVVAIDDGVDNGLVLQGVGCSLHKRRHEAELEAKLLLEGRQVGLSEADNFTENVSLDQLIHYFTQVEMKLKFLYLW